MDDYGFTSWPGVRQAVDDLWDGDRDRICRQQLCDTEAVVRRNTLWATLISYPTVPAPMPLPAFSTIILCDSVHHQNTAKIARAIADPLAACVVEPEQARHDILDQYDLIGFGSGVYFGRLHPALFQWLDTLPDKLSASTIPRKPAFIFSTSGLSFLAPFWHAPLKGKLAQKGFDLIAEFHCRGFDTWGPLWLVGGINKHHPDQHDLERAASFARRLLGSCRQPPA